MIKRIGLTAIASVYVAVVQVVILGLSASYLQTSELGLISICGAIGALSAILIDSGLGTYIVYKRNLDRNKLNSLLILSFAAALLLWQFIDLIAFNLETFFKAEGLQTLLFYYQINFFFAPFIGQFQALLVLEQNLGKVAMADIVSKTVGLCLTYVLLEQHEGVIAVAFGIVSSSFSKASLLYFSLPKECKLSRGVDFSVVPDVWRYCKYQLGGQFLNFVRMYVDIFIVGKVFGVQQLGVYSLARDLVGKVPTILGPFFTKVVFPAISRAKDHKDERSLLFTTSNQLIVYVNTVVYSVLAMFSVWVSDFLLGGKEGVSDAIIILALYYTIRGCGLINGMYLQAIGNVSKEFKWNLFAFIVFPISLLLLTNLGFYGYLCGTVVVQLILMTSSYFYFHNPTYPLRPSLYFSQSFSVIGTAVAIVCFNSVLLAKYTYWAPFFAAPLAVIILSLQIYKLIGFKSGLFQFYNILIKK